MDKSIQLNGIEQKIFIIRGKKVMINRDLAELYEVSTKVLNQAVKRNRGRFPGDFMFQLNEVETDGLVTICDRFKKLKHSSAPPYAFTEQGVAMLSSVLKSERAVRVNIWIMRAFVRMRETLATHKELTEKLKELEGKFDKHDKEIRTIFDSLNRLMSPPSKSKREIGFHAG